MISSVGKSFRLAAADIVDLVGVAGACYASDRITVDGCKVGYCYREEPDFSADSGWRFFSGDETQEYVDAPENFEIYNVNTIANYDRDIITILGVSAPAEFERARDGSLRRR
jgi:hypothetical protein